MKRYFYILSVWCILFTMLCACEQVIDYGSEGDTGIDIPIPEEGYIFFSANMEKTRGAEVESGPLTKDFKVLGYRYPSSWDAIKPQAKQTLRINYTDNDGNLVSDQDPAADNYVGVFGESIPGVQQVAYNNGTHSYSPLKGWQKNLKYAFYAWYAADYSNLTVNGGNETHEGAPYIQYTLPDGVDGNARSGMIDLLTACHIDYTKKDGMTVPMEMNHRLAALDVQVKNLINAKALKETYSDVFGTVADDAPVTLDVTGFSLSLSGMYTTAKIPLNDKDANEQIEVSDMVDRVYTGFDGATGIPENTPTSIIGDDEMLILIPQTTPIDVALVISYTVKCGDKEKSFEVDSKNQEIEITIDDLEGGVFHYLTLSLTKSGLFVQAEKAVTWDEIPDVEHTFE